MACRESASVEDFIAIHYQRWPMLIIGGARCRAAHPAQVPRPWHAAIPALSGARHRPMGSYGSTAPARSPARG